MPESKRSPCPSREPNQARLRIRQFSGPGQPLDPATRAFFEPRFGHDFSHVRVHADAKAAEAARAVNARAFTVGREVVFGEREYAPETDGGRRLLGHELTHVVQQGGGARSDLNSDSVYEHSPGVSNVAAAALRGDLTVQCAATVCLMRAPGPDDYVKPTPEIMGIVKQMEDELANLRVSAEPAKSAQAESVRTFCVVKIVDQNGKIKMTATGAYMGKGLHAEPDALGKLDMSKISVTDTTLLIVDQLPCDDRCTPAINTFRGKVQGELRVFTKVKVDPQTRLGGSPKTAALSPTKTGQELMELTEFQKLRSPTTAGAPTVTGRAGSRELPSTPRIEELPPGSEVKKPVPTTVKPAIGEFPPAIEKPPTTSVKAPPVEPELVPSAAPPSEGLLPSGLPRPSITATGEAIEEVSKLRSLMRGFARGMKLFFSPKVQIPLMVVLELLNALQSINMATSALSGEGFVLTDEIKNSREIKEKADLMLNHYKEGYHEDLLRGVTLANLLIVVKGSTDAKNEVAGDAAFTIPLLETRLSEAQELLVKVSAIKSEANTKHKIAKKLLTSKEFAFISAPMGTVPLAQVFGASEDFNRIDNIMGDAKNYLTELDSLIKEDIVTLKFYL